MGKRLLAEFRLHAVQSSNSGYKKAPNQVERNTMRKILLATVAVLALALYGWSAIAEPAGNIPLFLGGKHKNLAANFIVATTAAVDQKIFIFRLLV
jgi:hypothetical protein